LPEQAQNNTEEALMKKLLILLVLAIFVSAATLAEARKTSPTQQGPKQTTHLTPSKPPKPPNTQGTSNNNNNNRNNRNNNRHNPPAPPAAPPAPPADPPLPPADPPVLRMSLLDQILTDNPGLATKWSQPPALTQAYGFPIESNITSDRNVVAADDWLCTNGLPITDIHWWGSYLNLEDGAGLPAIDGFGISIHADISGAAAASHPGQLLESYFFSFSQANQTFYGADQTGNDVYQYYVNLPDAFTQTQGTVYWLDIEAIAANIEGPVWGWHTATLTDPGLAHNIDDAVQMFDYNRATGQYDPNFQEQIFQLPSGGSVSLDLAFELTTIPEPATIIMIGGALAGLATIIRKKFKK
jgi:hypothetical protein